jgi:hypothetical protein
MAHDHLWIYSNSADFILTDFRFAWLAGWRIFAVVRWAARGFMLLADFGADGGL